MRFSAFGGAVPVCGLVLVAACSLLAPVAHAQDAATPDQPPPEDSATAQSVDEAPVEPGGTEDPPEDPAAESPAHGQPASPSGTEGVPLDLSGAAAWIIDHWQLSIFGGLVLFFFLVGAWSSLDRRVRVYGFYAITLLVVFLWSATQSQLPYLYFWAFFLGVLTAFAEIIQKFGDEPLHALGTIEAYFYHVFNGVIAAFALKILVLTDLPTAMPFDRIKIVLAAGLGSMLVMRSKLFSVKVKGDEIAFGPEQLINIFLRFMESAIDRVRASVRIDFVTEQMDNLDFEAVYDYTKTMLESSQALGDEKDELLQEMAKIRSSKTTDPQLRSYSLGFRLLNTMGEDFVANLFDRRDLHPEWLIDREREAPREQSLIQKAQSLLKPKKEPAEKTTPIFLYDTAMSNDELARRLDWEKSDLMELQPDERVKCRLPDHRISLDARTDPAATVGLPTIVESPDDFVEGIRYRLPSAVVQVLSDEMRGYETKTVTVLDPEGAEVEVRTFVAREREPGLPPDPDVLEDLIRIAKEQDLDGSYLKDLQRERPAPGREPKAPDDPAGPQPPPG